MENAKAAQQTESGDPNTIQEPAPASPPSAPEIPGIQQQKSALVNSHEPTPMGLNPTGGRSTGPLTKYDHGGEHDDEEIKRNTSAGLDGVDVITREKHYMQDKLDAGEWDPIGSVVENIVTMGKTSGTLDYMKKWLINKISPGPYPTGPAAIPHVIKSVMDPQGIQYVDRPDNRPATSNMTLPVNPNDPLRDQKTNPDLYNLPDNMNPDKVLRSDYRMYNQFLGTNYGEDLPESSFKPSTAKDPDAKYYSASEYYGDPQKLLNRMSEYGGEGEEGTYLPRNEKDLDKLKAEEDDTPGTWSRGMGVNSLPFSDDPGDTDTFHPMENWTMGAGEDKKGKYISIYDKYDFKSEKVNSLGKPFEIYDRIYYTVDKNGKRKYKDVKRDGGLRRYSHGGPGPHPPTTIVGPGVPQWQEGDAPIDLGMMDEITLTDENPNLVRFQSDDPNAEGYVPKYVGGIAPMPSGSWKDLIKGGVSLYRNIKNIPQYIKSAKGLFKSAKNVPAAVPNTPKPPFRNNPNHGNVSPDMERQYVSDILKQFKGLGKTLDDTNFQVQNLTSKNLKYHGSISGRNIVETDFGKHGTQLFYKSSGLAGKSGSGVGGTTEGLWQPYGGNINRTKGSFGGNSDVPNWFIKDAGYKDFYGSKTFRDVSGRLDYLTKDMKFGKQYNASTINKKGWRDGGLRYDEGGTKEDGDPAKKKTLLNYIKDFKSQHDKDLDAYYNKNVEAYPSIDEYVAKHGSPRGIGLKRMQYRRNRRDWGEGKELNMGSIHQKYNYSKSRTKAEDKVIKGFESLPEEDLENLRKFATEASQDFVGKPWYSQLGPLNNLDLTPLKSYREKAGLSKEDLLNLIVANEDASWADKAGIKLINKIISTKDFEEGGLRKKKKKARNLREYAHYVKGQEEGSKSTHLMKWYDKTDKGYPVAPSITTNKEGYDPQTYDQALDRDEVFFFKTERGAKRFAAGNWKKGKDKREAMRKWRKEGRH
jgi:hypothetical protein